MKKIKKLFKIFVVLMIVAVISYGGLYAYAKMIDKVKITNNNSYLMYDNTDEIFNMSNSWVPLEDISENLVKATLSIEDKNFYKHIGFDYLRIAKALLINLESKKNVQGASTITQQYAKNLFLDFDKTWDRKINEAWITIQLESHYSKDEILEGYLNTINYGGVFGIDNASYYYFGKSSKDLTLAEASIIAGIPKSPSNYSPITNLNNAKRRQRIILNSMVKNNYIIQSEADKAYNENLKYIGKNKNNESKTLMYYQDAVLNELNKIKDIPKSLMKTGSLKIFTNLDLKTQIDLEKNLNTNMEIDDELQTSSIMMDPKNGKIIALIGGRDYGKSQYNRAISSKRQVGSTLKPFLYYSALENGFTASTTFNSSETTFVFSDNNTYSPKNYAEIYGEKDISMATALAYSDNIYAVKTHVFLGESTLVNLLKRVGVTSSLPEIPSLALGTSELSMYDMMKSYSTLANEGKKVTPHLIEKITDLEGNILYEFKEKNGEVVLNESTAYIVNEMLSNCTSSNFIDYNYPTCINIASKLTNKMAIKTGTTDTDHLIFGFNKDIVLGVWSGYDENKNTYPNVSNYIKFAFADTIENYFKDKKTSWYETPTNVTGVMVNPITGQLAKEDDPKKSIFYFIKGTEPKEVSSELDDLIPTIKTE